MLFLVPQGQFQKHLHTLAEIAKLLHKKDFRKALEESPDAAAMYQTIKSQSGTKV
jgi:mannitol/fructose-specific phosphotransferase system IIA component (Ntr-type)